MIFVFVLFTKAHFSVLYSRKNAYNRLDMLAIINSDNNKKNQEKMTLKGYRALSGKEQKGMIFREKNELLVLRLWNYKNTFYCTYFLRLRRKKKERKRGEMKRNRGLLLETGINVCLTSRTCHRIMWFRINQLTN